MANGLTGRERAVSDQYGSARHTRPLLPLRGRDRCGRNAFDIGHPRGAAPDAH